jgi:hypothetical protein
MLSITRVEWRSQPFEKGRHPLGVLGMDHLAAEKERAASSHTYDWR